MDIVSRYRILHRVTPADKLDIAGKGVFQINSFSLCSLFNHNSSFAATNIRGYIPFYILYYIFMALQAQIAQTALGIGRRYRRLNIALQKKFQG